MTIRTLVRNPLIPEGATPCHGLSHLFTAIPVDPRLLPDLLARCGRCHMTSECARIALDIERPSTTGVAGIWGGVYVTAPSDRMGGNGRRLAALARLQAVADRSMAVAR